MMEKEQLEEIKSKLYEKLKVSGWGDKLKGYLLSNQFEDLILTLDKEVNKGNRFTPPMKIVFKALEECPYKDLKVVMIGQDPYSGQGVADGLAFSGANMTPRNLQPSLDYILDEIQSSVYKEEKYDKDPDLKRWANQGVLLLNTALTTQIGKIGTHYLIWRPFIAYLLDILGCYNPGLIYIFMGQEAKKWADSIPVNNYKFFIEHPAAAYYRKDYKDLEKAKWRADDVFNKINDLLFKANGYRIIW